VHTFSYERYVIGWSTSKLFRWEINKLNQQLTVAENKLRAEMSAKVKVYSSKEIEQYSKERGIPYPKKRRGPLSRG